MGLERVPDRLVSQVFKLNLPMRLIGDGKKVFPMIFKGRNASGGYTVLLELGRNNEFRNFSSWEVEMKGRVDIEFLKYRGKVVLLPVKDDPGYYTMIVANLYKENQRQRKRVPYRRKIDIIRPVPQPAIMLNLSATGMMFRCQKEITQQEFDIEVVLAQRLLNLSASIVEQKYNEIFDMYEVRCQFIGIKAKDQKLISAVVREITLQAKERLEKQS